jgi:toxin ParE1/3/4
MKPVVWSAEARQDYLDILRYIADNPLAAEKVVDVIEKIGNELGRFATGRPGRVTGTYEKSITRLPYIIAYALATRADRESVVILRVIHSARDWPAEEWPR